jgi:hypothetical protein
MFTNLIEKKNHGLQRRRDDRLQRRWDYRRQTTVNRPEATERTDRSQQSGEWTTGNRPEKGRGIQITNNGLQI